MDSTTVSSTYGADRIDLSVPSSFQAGPVIRPRALPTMDEAAILESMRGALARAENSGGTTDVQRRGASSGWAWTC